MRGILVVHAPPVGFLDHRQRNTWELLHHVGGIRQTTVYRRRAGDHSSVHFHKGKDPSKNPEEFYLFAGRAQFRFWNGVEAEAVLLDASRGPVKLQIWPGILHFMEAVSDCLYVEVRRTRFDRSHPDTYPACDFWTPPPKGWFPKEKRKFFLRV